MKRIFDFLEINQNGIMKVIGAKTEEEYNYLLRKIYYLTENNNSYIVYNEGIPFPSNTDIISLIQDCVKTMNLNCIEREEINLTNNLEFNIKLKRAIDLTLGNVLREKSFKSENVKNNFFIKQICWIYEMIYKTNFLNMPTIIYYGEMTEDEKYLLEILGYIGFKILVFSSNVDIDIKATENIIFEKRIPFVRYKTRVAQGLDELPSKEELVLKENLIVIKSVAKQAKEEIEEDFIQSGIYKPWKFRKGYIKSINIDSVVEDLTSYIKEDSRFRDGFKCDGKVVYVPNFFMKINGVYRDKSKFKSLIDTCIKNPLTLVKENLNFIDYNSFPTQDIYSFAFLLNESQSEIDIEKVKKHKLYSLNNYNIDAQNLALKKLNEFYTIYNNHIDLKDFLDLLYVVMTLNEELMLLIENFDFPYKVPKIIIYLEKRECLNKINALLLHYLNVIGLDIIVFSPTGAPSIEDYLFDQCLSIVDLEEMIFDFSLSTVKSIKYTSSKKSLLKKFFGN